MPHRDNQNGKILTLLAILRRETDDEHRLSVPALVDKLQARDIPCERKSIYADIATLQQMGYDVNLRRGKNSGYALLEREFEMAELKLLVDAVQSSRMISEAKSEKLIKKLEKLVSVHQARQLQRQVFVSGRVKTQNTRGLYAVDTLYAAIDAQRMVSFQYNRRGVDKKLRPHGGERRVSPWGLAWENNAYYLIAYQEYREPHGMSHYRVDRMTQVTMLDEPRRGVELLGQFDPAAYIQPMFNMFGGDVVPVTLRCKDHLADAMLDRFGLDVILFDEGDGHFHFTAKVVPSPQFYGWVCGFGGAVEITAPAWVRGKMCKLAETLQEQYPEE